MNNKILVFIPTYNEKENVRRIYKEILELPFELEILFIDDNSPDGTGDLLDELAKEEKRLKVIHREGKLGIGSAHLDGIKYAYKNKYTKLITMDCDFTHPPENIKDLLRVSDNYAVVVTSRYLDKDSLKEWNLFRKTLTWVGHFLTTVMLSLPYDATGGFRLYNLEKVKEGVFELAKSRSYSFLFETLFIINMNKYSISEISVQLPARTYGHSKMALNDVAASVKFLNYLFFNKLFRPKEFILP